MSGELRVVSLAERPDLLGAALELGDVGAEFMLHDPVATLVRARRMAARWPGLFLVVLAGEVPVARAVGVPVAFPTAERTELPAHGWDGAIVWAAEDALDGAPVTTLVALDVQVATGSRGRGIAARALAGLREAAGAHGLRRLVVPVRPTGKQELPHLSMREYLARRREDGRWADPWLRTHERAGARLLGIAPQAMTITGTLAQWRQWTGVELRAGPNVIEGALVPVLGVPEQDLGVYVEPNVWLEHPPPGSAVAVSDLGQKS